MSSRYLPQQLASSQPGSPAAACFAPPITCAHGGCLRPASPLPPVRTADDPKHAVCAYSRCRCPAPPLQHARTADACILHRPCHQRTRRLHASCNAHATCEQLIGASRSHAHILQCHSHFTQLSSLACRSIRATCTLHLPRWASSHGDKICMPSDSRQQAFLLDAKHEKTKLSAQQLTAVQ